MVGMLTVMFVFMRGWLCSYDYVDSKVYKQYLGGSSVKNSCTGQYHSYIITVAYREFFC